MTYNYRTKGVCSKEMHIELNDDHTIKSVEVIGGCNGNLQGISRLVEGMKAEDAIARMRGIRCGFKNTSCPDQLAIALCPGISRSGMTITAGCFTGFERKFAVRFAFLLSIPAVLGANILTLKDAIEAGIDFSSVPVYLVGVVVAAVSGYASIRLLRYVADKGRFGAFAYYCWAAGVLTLVLTILH